MTPAWTQRQEELLRDCIVSPDIFTHTVDRLCDFVVPYQHVLETKAGQRNSRTHEIRGRIADPIDGLLGHF